MYVGHLVQLAVSGWCRDMIDAWRMWLATIHHTYHIELALQRERLRYEALMTQLREAETQHQAQLAELQPYTDLGRIGTGLVHDLTNPLTAAMLTVGELSEEYPNPLSRQAMTSLRRLDRYLRAARRQIRRESELRLFSVNFELRQVLQIVKYQAQRNRVELRLHGPPGVKLYGDAVKFNQVIANVISNAIDAAGKMADPKRRLVAIAVRPHRGFVAIRITDYGAGLKLHDRTRLFQPFYSSKRTGLGVGLALVKQYVEQDFSGSIDVRSTARRGTSFTLRLYDHPRPAAPAAVRKRPLSKTQ